MEFCFSTYMQLTIAGLKCSAILLATHVVSLLNLARGGSQHVEKESLMLVSLNSLLLVSFHYFGHELSTIAKR